MLNHEIRVNPSKQYILLIILLLTLSLLIIFSLQTFVWVKVWLGVATWIYGLYILWAFGFLQAATAILSLRPSVHNSWQLTTRDTVILGQLSGESTVTVGLCVLRFVIPGKRRLRSCIIFKDSLEKGMYRRLLVQLHTARSL